ncbi:MAG: hypothetical protein KDD61_07655 [Bdellovibrionales bacterium]|nr:hypothetical protein [Bdellovibrionales bacterium]
MKVFAYLVPLLALIYSYPRLIVGWLGEENPWTSYLYMYGFGFVFFFCGILLILKTKSCQLGRGRDTFWFNILLGGFVAFASFHAIWIYLALYMPVKGGL